MQDRISINEACKLQEQQFGTPTELTESFLRKFVPDEGELNVIYGKIGQGKTTLACSMIVKDLMNGQVVYSSFPLDWSGYDERNDFWAILLGLLGIKKTFYEFPKENYHHLDCFADDIWDKLDTLTDCKIYFDDVIVQLFDSYEKTYFSKKKREWAFFTRHFDRSIYLITQRTSQIQVALRSQVHRFYKCEKLISWPFILFRRSEYQDMVDEDVKDDEYTKPDSVSLVLGDSKIFSLFNSKYLRNGKVSSQKVFINAFALKYSEVLKLCSVKLEKIFAFLKKQKFSPDFEKLNNDVSLAGVVSSKVASIKNISKAEIQSASKLEVKSSASGVKNADMSATDQLDLPF